MDSSSLDAETASVTSSSLPDNFWQYETDDDESSILDLLRTAVAASPTPSMINATLETVGEEEDGDDNGEHDSDNSTNGGCASPTTVATTVTVNSSLSTSAEALEEKFMTLKVPEPVTCRSENDALATIDDSTPLVDVPVVTDDLVEDFKNADPADLDTILANQMNTLSMEERDECLTQVVGIGRSPVARYEEDNDPQFVQQKLCEMDYWLKRIPHTKHKEAYERAKYISPEYVNDPKFRLCFLRGELYNPRKAAGVVLSHFHIKCELFGPDKLGRNILLSDLSESDMEELKSGTEQILPVRDRADRMIIMLGANNNTDYKNIQGRLRSIFYIATTFMLNDDVQKNGFVMLVLNTGQHSLFFEHLPYLLQTTKVTAGLPFRPAAFHYAFDKPYLYPLAMATRVLVKNSAGKFILHSGT